MENTNSTTKSGYYYYKKIRCVILCRYGLSQVFISFSIYIFKDIPMLREMSLWITRKYIKRNGFDRFVRARFRLRFGYFMRIGLGHFIKTGLGYFMRASVYHLTRAGLGYFMRA